MFDFSGNWLRSRAHAALAPLGTASSFTDTHKITAGVQEMPGCTGDSSLGVHVPGRVCKEL